MAAAKKKSAPSPSQPAPAPSEPIVLGLVPRGELREIPLDSIIDPPGTPDRIDRPGDNDRILDTARSLREVGQLQPIMVEARGDGNFTRVFGRRRLAAARFNQAAFGDKDTILAIVVPPLEPDVRRTIVAVENVQRQDLTPAEEHLAVHELIGLQAWTAARQVHAPMPIGPNLGKTVNADIEAFHAKDSAGNQQGYRNALLENPKVKARACELVAAMLAKDVVWVRDRMYIGRLGEKSRRLVLEGKLPLTHAREIAKVADPEIREDLAKSYAAGGDESVSDVEAGHLADLQEEVRERLFNLKVVPWRLDVPVGTRPACDGCPHNSATNTGLFDHGGEVSATMVGGVGRQDWTGRDPKDLASAVCTMHTCYGDKLRTTKAAVSAAAKRIVDGGKKPAEAKVPAFIEPKALEKRVRDRRANVKASGSRPKAAASNREDDVPFSQRPGYKAKQKYDTALEKWCKPAKEAMRKKCKADPILAIALELLFNHSTVQDAKEDINYEGKVTKPKRVLTETECANLVADAVPMKTLAQLDDLARHAADTGEFSLDGPFYAIEDCVGIFERACAVLGISLKGERPMFADFLAAELPKTPAAKDPKPAKGKKKAAVASEEVDDAD